MEAIVSKIIWFIGQNFMVYQVSKMKADIDPVLVYDPVSWRPTVQQEANKESISSAFNIYEINLYDKSSLFLAHHTGP